MRETDVLILGGLSGITAGISCRRHYPDKKVMVVRKEGTILIPCGIPYIYGTVGGPQYNVIPDGLLESNQIELIKGEAILVDRENKVVTLKDDESINMTSLCLRPVQNQLFPQSLELRRRMFTQFGKISIIYPKSMKKWSM